MLLNNPTATRIFQVIKQIFLYVFPLIFIALIAVKLKKIGWHALIHALPTNPLCYALQIPAFFLLPITEKMIFRTLLGTKNSIPLVILFRKRVLNTNVLEYSGETYLFNWMTKNRSVTRAQLFHAVKDSALLSGVAGFVVFLAVALYLLLSSPAISGIIAQNMKAATILVILLPVIPALFFLNSGKKEGSFSKQQLAGVFFIHLFRSAGALTLDMLIIFYASSLYSFYLSFEIVALRLFITRIPFLPSKDLVFIWLGISAAKVLNVPQAGLATVLMIMTSLQQILDYLLIGLPWLAEYISQKHLGKKKPRE